MENMHFFVHPLLYCTVKILERLCPQGKVGGRTIFFGTVTPVAPGSQYTLKSTHPHAEGDRRNNIPSEQVLYCEQSQLTFHAIPLI